MCAALLGHEVAGRRRTWCRESWRWCGDGPLPPCQNVSPREIMDAMRRIKRTRGKAAVCVAKKLGQGADVDGVPEKTVECVLRCAPQVFVKRGIVG